MFETDKLKLGQANMFQTTGVQNTAHTTTNQRYNSILEVAGLMQPDEPVQCFFPHKLKQQIDIFRSGFNGDIAFAVKANPSANIISLAYTLGVNTFDVASIAEIRLVTDQAPQATLHYHNPIKSVREITTAYETFNCKRFAIDDLEELRKIYHIIGKDADVEIAVRFRLPSNSIAVHDFSEKFGSTPQEAAGLISQVSLLGYTPVLTFHPGSQCTNPDGWHRHIIVAAQICEKANTSIKVLNVGGGFPAQYAQDETYDLTQFFTVIEQSVRDNFKNPPKVECEPGRSLVASTTSLLARVKHVRHSTREIYLNDGIYGSLLEMTQATSLTPTFKTIQDGQYITGQTAGKTAPYVVYGPTCDPLDRLPNSFQLPTSIQARDYIEFENLGAYGAATATRFNGYGYAPSVEIIP